MVILFVLRMLSGKDFPSLADALVLNLVLLTQLGGGSADDECLCEDGVRREEVIMVRWLIPMYMSVTPLKIVEWYIMCYAYNGIRPP